MYTSNCGTLVQLWPDGQLVLGQPNSPQKATVRFADKSLLDMRSNGQTIVHAGSTLVIQRGATLLVRAGGILNIYGEVVVEAGGYVCFENYSSVNVYAGGKLTISPVANQGANPIWGTLPCTGPPIPVANTCPGGTSSLAISATADFNPCSGYSTITASGSNLATNYRWTFDGYPDAFYDNKASFAYYQDQGTSTVIRVSVSSTCPNTAALSASRKVLRGFTSGCPQAVVMYPNPASTYVQFAATPPDAPAASGGSLPGAPVATLGTNGDKQADYKTFKVELYDGRGKKTKYKETTTGELRLDTSDLLNGLYHVTITQGKEVMQKNLSIEH